MTEKSKAERVQFRDVTLMQPLKERTPGDSNLGETTKELLARYIRIMTVEATTSGLNAVEWEALAIAMKGETITAAGPIRMDALLWAAWERGDFAGLLTMPQRDDELARPWDETATLHLMGKFKRLSYAQQWAVVDYLERRAIQQGGR